MKKGDVKLEKKENASWPLGCDVMLEEKEKEKTSEKWHVETINKSLYSSV